MPSRLPCSLPFRSTCPPSPGDGLPPSRTTTGAPSPWGSRPTGDPVSSTWPTSQHELGAPFIPLSPCMVAAPPSGRLPRSCGETAYPGSPRNRRGTEGWADAPLGTGVQAIRPSPYRAGLAGRRRTRLRTFPASTAGSGPLWLSPPGKPLTRRSSFRTSPASGRNRPGDETAHPNEAKGVE